MRRVTRFDLTLPSGKVRFLEVSWKPWKAQPSVFERPR